MLFPAFKDTSLVVDDAIAHHSSKCTQIITHRLQKVATYADRCYEANKMKLKIIKIKGALVGSNQRLKRITDSDKQIKIIINDIPIEQVSYSKLFGIHVVDMEFAGSENKKKLWLTNCFFSSVYDPSCQHEVGFCFSTTL